MSAITTFAAFDGATTPVSHTFYPEGVTDEPNGDLIANWKEIVAATPEYASNRVVVSKRKLKSGVVRLSVRVQIPVMESIAGQNASGYTAAPKVAYVDAGEMVFYAHPRSTLTGRRLVRQLLVNIAGGITTTVSPVTSGQIVEAVDLLLMPT